MNLSANKGEWSEFYAFLKILSDKVLYSADETLALIPDSFLKVLSVIRNEEDKNLIYESEEKQITIKSEDEVLAQIPVFQITEKLSKILNRIKEGKGSFTISEAQNIMEKLYCKKIKSSSAKKTDILLKIEDVNTGTKPVKGFSIKSKIGGLSTLFNSSKVTNFRFEIVQGIHKSKDKAAIDLDKILGSNETLKFSGMTNEIFQNNLIMIDSRMPEIIAEMLKVYYLKLTSNSDVFELVSYIEKINPLKIKNYESFYKHKIKEFLFDIDFGMRPKTPWNGDNETHGGYIIVKENGELACYHVYNRDKFRDFLFMNTKLDTPSRDRHDFGKVYEIDGKKYIDLNLQIRFKN